MQYADVSSLLQPFPIATTHNDQHAGSTGNFSPDKPGTHVDIYWSVVCETSKVKI